MPGMRRGAGRRRWRCGRDAVAHQDGDDRPGYGHPLGEVPTTLPRATLLTGFGLIGHLEAGVLQQLSRAVLGGARHGRHPRAGGAVDIPGSVGGRVTSPKFCAIGCIAVNQVLAGSFPP